ncbi:MAG: L-serine ammonia-lyase, iron-sulfur-dependent, subunit alpha [Clostridiales bacterium]|nr:L-serine ammonia-lyase, iron-sulfur-dependent, subunit alpha [Clostridiales bacterium]
MSFRSLAEILNKCKKEDKPFWRVVLEDDMEERLVTEEESFEKMKQLYMAMKGADIAYEEGLSSTSGLVGGDGARMGRALSEGKTLAGPFMGEVMSKALKMGESNACMKKIVAAPTGGACGVIPAVLLTYEEQFGAFLQQMIEAMYVAAGIGQVIAVRAFISGAAGGCQAEIGSASAMAAGALAYLNGGDGECITHAAAMSLKNLMGLACDTVAGLVEIPCVKRNVGGAVVAISSADMAVAGIRSQIPPDEVIDAMREVGESLPRTLRETGEGGLAATPRGIEIKNKLMS